MPPRDACVRPRTRALLLLLAVAAVAGLLVALVSRGADAPIGSTSLPDATSTSSPVPSTGVAGAGNTGVPAGVALRPSGSLTITQDGTVIDGLDVNGRIDVRANNVTIRNTRVRSINTGGNVGDGRVFSGTVIHDVTVDGRYAETMGIDGLNFTARRVNIFGTKNGFRLFSNTTVENSWVHDLYAQPGDHMSGIGSNGGSNFVIRGNTVECGTISNCSGSIVLYGDFHPINNVLVERNVLQGGLFGTHAGSAPGKHHPLATNVRYLNNTFGRKFYDRTGYYGPYASWSSAGAGNQWSGNVYEGTDQPV